MRVQKGDLAFRWLVQVLLFFNLTAGARALPSVSSPTLSAAEKLPFMAGFGSEISIQADFDGDHQPDLLTGRLQGSAYRIEIQFSSDPGLDKTRFLTSYRQYGIAVFVLDVNGDNDLDLVVTDCSSVFPRAVWLGDGKGHFQDGDPHSWLSLIAVRQATSYRIDSFRDGLPLDGPGERIPLDKPLKVSLDVVPPVGEVVPQDRHKTGSPKLLRQISVRAPPPYSPPS
jgi:hypothetical protein